MLSEAPLKDAAGSRWEGEDARWMFCGTQSKVHNGVLRKVRVNFGFISPLLPPILSDYCRQSLGEGRGMEEDPLYSNVTAFSLSAPTLVSEAWEGTVTLPLLEMLLQLHAHAGSLALSKWRHTSLSPVSALALGHEAHLTAYSVSQRLIMHFSSHYACDFGFGPKGRCVVQVENRSAALYHAVLKSTLFSSPCCGAGT